MCLRARRQGCAAEACMYNGTIASTLLDRIDSTRKRALHYIMEEIQLYLYSCRQIAQDIYSSLFFRAGPSQVLYFSPDLYETGARAAVNVPRSDLVGPTPAHPLFSPDGTMLRPGCGKEYRYIRPTLSFKSSPEWKPLEFP